MINIKKIKPTANYVVTTQDRYDNDVMEGGLIIKQEGALKEYQKVIAVGPVVRTVKEGDLVCINPRRYAKFKHQEGSLKDGVITDNPVIAYNFRMVEIVHENYLFITDSDIDFVIEDWEELPDEPAPIKVPETKIIL